MLSSRLRRGLAGLGVFAIGGLGLLTPTAAMAAAQSGGAIDPSIVKIGKTMISNDSIFPNGVGSFSFSVTPNACSEDGCVGVSDIPAIANVSVNLTAANTRVETDSFLPAASTYTKPGVYSWKVKETVAIANGMRSPVNAMSQAEYTIRVAIKKEGTDFAYSWITITKDKNDDGSVNGEKVDSLDFVNVSEDVGDLEVTKTVVNNAGRTEEGPYEIQVVFKWPDNFDGKVNTTTGKWTTTVPAVTFADTSEHTNGDCVVDADAETTTCTFKLASTTAANSKTAKLTNIPVGATYTVTELSTSANYATGIQNGPGVIPVRQWTGSLPAMTPQPPSHLVPTTEDECNGFRFGSWTGQWNSEGNVCDLAADQASMVGPDPAVATVTNTYEDIPPTGILLSYLPYALMVIVPLGGVGVYIAMRRKLLS